MKVLVVAVPQAGHLTPLLPLIDAFSGAGDQVVVASGPDIREAVQRRGVPFREAGQGFGVAFETLATRTRGAPGDGLPPERIPHYFIPRLFADVVVADMIDGALAVAHDVEPDIVLFDSEAFAGPLVASLVGARPVHHAIGPPIAADVLDLCSDALSPLWRSFGLPRPSYAGIYDGITVSITPESLGGGPLPGDVLPLRPAPLPTSPPAAQSPPLVYVTFGTMWANAEVVRTVVEAVRPLEAEVLVTLGAMDPAQLGAVPANVRVERFVPQADVLPACALVVDHAGSGTMLGALAHGLPQVLLPQAADNFLNAAAVTRAGAATTLLPHEVTVDAVRAAVTRGLTDPSLRSAAHRIASEIAAMPDPATVAGQIRRSL